MITTALKSRFTLVALAALAFAAAPALRATQTLTFNVNINTAGLSADAANSPFYLDLALSSNQSASDSVSLSNFVFTGGSATGSATTSGTGSGSLAGTVSLTSTSTTQGEVYQQFTSGVTNISFQVTVTEPGPDVGTPAEFTASIFDNSLGSPAQLYTTAPDTESLVTLNLSPSNDISDVNAYAATSSADGNTPISDVTASVSAVPEPSTTAAIFGCAILGLVAFRRLKKSSSVKA